MPRFEKYVTGRMWLRVLTDALAIVIAYYVALIVRFELSVPEEFLARFVFAIPVILVIFIVGNYTFKLYARRWKYGSFDELVHLTSATTISTVVVVLIVLFMPARDAVPVSVALIGGVLSLFLLAFMRLQYRFMVERSIRGGTRGSRKVLLVGAGEAGEMVARDMLRHLDYDYSPVGFIDDDPGKRKMVIQGVPVLGNKAEIPRIARKHEIDEIFITIPSATGETIRGILQYCEETDARIKILPGIVLTMAGEVGVGAIRELELEDLLGREPVETDIASISAYIEGKVVMVTGAGGSIGSELARQLCTLLPSKLILLDNDETSLYDLDLELATCAGACPVEVVVADIRDQARLNSVFKRYHPQVIFHSAALKQVPMMESNASEAVKNNIMGTLNLALTSINRDAERFILISTDKAVHPVSVMGATKRTAELLMKSFDKQNGTLFSAVRFGNVLGSRGSVVPIFQKQIEKGGPVLVTHPDITRYFMTIPEAAQLVIQAGAYTEGGDVFILDMGEPVRIMDLAQQMIKLLADSKDIAIEITGLRPGEKLNEALVFNVEESLATAHPKINRVVHDIELPGDLDEQVSGLAAAAERDDHADIIARLSRLVPSYSSEGIDEGTYESGVLAPELSEEVAEKQG